MKEDRISMAPDASTAGAGMAARPSPITHANLRRAIVDILSPR